MHHFVNPFLPLFVLFANIIIFLSYNLPCIYTFSFLLLAFSPPFVHVYRYNACALSGCPKKPSGKYTFFTRSLCRPAFSRI